jgi:long-chain acyl-CoA synthetase
MKPNNLVEMLWNTVQRFPTKGAIMWKVDGSYRELTYEDFWNRIYHIASGLAHLGIKEGDKVAILSNSNPMWGITDFAVASLGAVSVPIYPTLPSEQVAYILKNADVRLAVVENEEQREKIQIGQDVENVIIMYPGSEFSEGNEGLSFTDLEEEGKQNLILNWEEQWRRIDGDQLATIIHTSGTTGNPKGVMLTHGNFLANIEAVQFWLIELRPDDLALSYLPLSHVFERMAGHYMPFSVGTTIAYAESINTIQENLKEVRPTVLTSVPRLFEKVYAKVQEQIEQGSSIKRKIFNWAVSVGVERYETYLHAPVQDLILKDSMPKKLQRKWKIADRLVFQKVKTQLGGRMRGMVSGGATLNPDISKFFWALDLPILEGYGLTETSPVITTNPMLRAKTGTVGKVLPNLEVKIAPDGEVLVRGPSVMKGYYKDSEATEEAFDGDWFKTGDIGQLDQENYLKIVDRKKRILVLSTGKNVAPQLIESAMNESNFIGQSVVLGDKQKYVICLVNPDFENLLPWAKKNGIHSRSTEEICQHPRVQKLIGNEVNRLTKGFAKFEQPKRVVIIGKEWTIEGGELTPKLSTRTKVIEEKYKQEIERAYQESIEYDSRAEAVASAEKT